MGRRAGGGKKKLIERVEWDLNGPQFGMTPAQWSARRPPLMEANELIYRIWHFCGGWKPEVLELAFALHEVIDPAFTVEQLLVIREKVEAWQRVQSRTK